MKISKINHTRSSISIQNRYGEGILYKSPAGEKLDEKHKDIAELKRNSKKLYSLFIPCQLRSKEEKDAYRLEKTFFDNWVKKSLIKDQAGVPVLEKKEDIAPFMTREAVSTFVCVGLRNSLRRNIKIQDYEKVYVPEVLAEMMYLAISGEKTEKIKQQITETVFEKVADFIKEDYTKEHQITAIFDSIEKNNVTVQIADTDNAPVLQLANAEHSRKIKNIRDPN